MLIHGFAGNKQTWKPWVDELSKRHELHLVDLKGFGQAPRPRDNHYSVRDLARPVVDYVVSEGLRGPTLVGHSLGGAVVMLTALELHERGDAPDPSRLILVAGAAYPQRVPPFLRTAAAPWIGGALLRMVPMRWLIKQALRKVYFEPADVNDDQIRAYADPIRARGGRYAVRATARQLVPDDADEIVQRFPQLSMPTLLLWGRNDSVVPLDTAHRLLELLPKAELKVLERCGHIPSEERPEASLLEVQTFLSATSPEE